MANSLLRLTDFAQQSLINSAKGAKGDYPDRTEYQKIHIPRLTEEILTAAKGLSGRALILNPNDHPHFPYKILSSDFEQVVLFTSPLLKAHTSQKFVMRSCDDTRALASLSNQCEEDAANLSQEEFVEKLPEIMKNTEFSSCGIEDFEVPHSYSLVISHYCTAYLPAKVEHYLSDLVQKTYGVAKEAFAISKAYVEASKDLSKRMQAHHMKLLHQLVAPNGRVLFSDPQSRTIPRGIIDFHFPSLGVERNRLFRSQSSKTWDITVTPPHRGVVLSDLGVMPGYIEGNKETIVTQCLIPKALSDQEEQK